MFSKMKKAMETKVSLGNGMIATAVGAYTMLGASEKLPRKRKKLALPIGVGAGLVTLAVLEKTDKKLAKKTSVAKKPETKKEPTVPDPDESYFEFNEDMAMNEVDPEVLSGEEILQYVRIKNAKGEYDMDEEVTVEEVRSTIANYVEEELEKDEEELEGALTVGEMVDQMKVMIEDGHFPEMEGMNDDEIADVIIEAMEDLEYEEDEDTANEVETVVEKVEPVTVDEMKSAIKDML